MSTVPTRCGVRIAIAVAALVAGHASANSIHWDGQGGADDNWGSAINWFDATTSTNDVLPASGDDAFLGSSYTPAATARIVGGSEQCKSLTLGVQNGQAGVLHVLGAGSLRVPALHLGDMGTGEVYQSGGSVRVDLDLSIGYSFGGVDGVGTYNLSAGTLDTTGFAYIGDYNNGQGTFNHSGGVYTAWDITLGGDPEAKGTYILSDMAAVTVESLYVGDGGQGTFMHLGGTATVTSYLSVGCADWGPDGTGEYTLSGGTLNVIAPGAEAVVGDYNNGVGVFQHSAGVHNVNALTLGWDANARGTYTLSGTGELNAAELYVGDGGHGTFHQTGGTCTVSSYLSVGLADNGPDGAGEYNLSGGVLDVTGPDAGAYIGDCNAGQGVFNHSAGVHNVTYLTLGWEADARGTYTLSGTGELNVAELYVGDGGRGTFHQTGGVCVVTAQLSVGCADNAPHGAGEYNLTGGMLDTTAEDAWVCIGENNNGQGTFTHTGGTHLANIISLGYGPGTTGVYNLSDAAVLDVSSNGTWDGELWVGDGDGTGVFNQAGGTLQGNGSLFVRGTTGASGTYQGWGVVGLTGEFWNDGRVVADGSGSPQTLDCSSFSAVLNDIENPAVGGANGWFARNQGRLLLPSLVIDGDAEYTWGEDPDDPVLDLVNGLRMTLAGVAQDGLLTISLMAPDHPTLPPGTVGSIVGLWSLDPDGSLAFATADLVFRYDDALTAVLGLAEDELDLYHFSGGQWLRITTDLDTEGNLIYADGVTAFSLFAAGKDVRLQQPGEDVPEPGTLSLLGLGCLGVWGRCRRRRAA